MNYKSLLRCRICDYSEKYGSNLTNEPPGKKRVLFYEKNQEYLCDDCAGSILEAYVEMCKDDADYNHLKLMESLKR